MNLMPDNRALIPRVEFHYFRTDWASSIIRGHQVASNLGCPAVPFDEERAQRAELIVYIKLLPDVRTMERLRALGVRQILDVLDNYDFRCVAKAAPLLDGLIAANRTHEIYLSRRFGLPTRMIPHHHCNYSGRRIEIREGDPIFGYIGHKNHWPANRFMHKCGYRVSTCFDFTDLERIYLSIDVGFAFRRNLKKLMLNSALKLVNFMSFGIPCIMSPESGYMEIARHGRECLFGWTKDEFLNFSRYLAENPAIRRAMADEAYENARAFSLPRVLEQYRLFFNEVMDI